jgi:hypothetical protein
MSVQTPSTQQSITYNSMGRSVKWRDQTSISTMQCFRRDLVLDIALLR